MPVQSDIRVNPKCFFPFHFNRFGLYARQIPTKIQNKIKPTTCFTVINASSIIISLCYIFHCLLYICLQCEYSTRKHGCPVFFYTKKCRRTFLFRILLRHCLFCSFCPICLSVIGMHFLPYASYFFNSPTPSGYGPVCTPTVAPI